MEDIEVQLGPVEETLCDLFVRKPLPLSTIEEAAVTAAWVRSGGSVSAACRALGIGRTTMYRKMRKYGLIS